MREKEESVRVLAEARKGGGSFLIQTEFERGNKILQKIFYQDYWFLGNGGPVKISLLQCYEVAWTYSIDNICTF